MNGTAFFHVNNVKIKIEGLLKPSGNSLNSQSQEILKLIYKHVESFEEISKTTLDTNLDELIGFEVRALERIIDEVDSKSENNENGAQFSLDKVQNLKQRIHSFITRLKMEEQRYADGLYNLIPGEEEEEEDDDSDTISSKMIGVSDVYQELKDTISRSEIRSQVTTLVGMPGIGKTTLASKLFHDPKIVETFDHRLWVRVGKNCRVKDIPRRILAEMDPESLQTLPEGDEEAVHEYLKARLKSKRYLIVLDDVWDRFAMYLLHPDYRYRYNELDHPFLHPESVSRILLTSRLQQLNDTRERLIPYMGIITVRLLNKEESWDLLCEKVFCKGSSCPPELEKAGRKISENCDGLPLTILTVARLLSEEETATPEYWSTVAAKKNHQLFLDAYNEISKVLLPSYTYLPQLLQMCFFYIGLFPRNYEIPRSKLINLWMADGFFELNINIKSDLDAIGCLEELVSNNVVMAYKLSTFTCSHTVKTCGLHSSLLHLSRQKASETKFALVLSSHNDSLGDRVKGHNRLSFNNNSLFGIKAVNKAVESYCASATRSLLCFGPYHQYQVPLCFRLPLLKELDALSIRFYEFPVEVLQLVRLKYLAFTSNGMIPPSISQLSCLQFLIVDRHQNIKSFKGQSYLPMEIWSLQDLRHLQVMGSDLPDPRGAYLLRLSTLLNVSFRSCTQAVFKGLPCLKELKIRIELAPYNDGKPLRCFTHISDLHGIQSLKCVIVNPEVVPPVVPFSSFPPSYLTSLSLSGLGYSWKEMREIALLPHLSVLKLKNYAFQGPEWGVEGGGFLGLHSLVVEDTDMVNWQFGYGSFIALTSLILKNCYKLKNIRGEFYRYLEKIELVDCNPSCVVEMKKAISRRGKFCVLDVHASWNDKKRKTEKGLQVR